MTDSARNSDNYCYRHPDRESYILCQRCGRTICPQCQTQASVGVHCPECVLEARQNAPKRKPAIVTAMRPGSGKPVVTFAIIGITLAVFVVNLLLGGMANYYLTYYPILTAIAPWTMLTAALAHSSIFHIALNMFALFLFGPALEKGLGRARFIALYVLSAFGGSVAVLLLSPSGGVLGASGAIFGLLGAFFVIQRGLGGNTVQLAIVIGLNLALGFFIANISWEAHLGGLIVGAGVALIYMRTRERARQRTQLVLLATTAIVLVAITVAGFARFLV